MAEREEREARETRVAWREEEDEDAAVVEKSERESIREDAEAIDGGGEVGGGGEGGGVEECEVRGGGGVDDTRCSAREITSIVSANEQMSGVIVASQRVQQ